MNNYFCVLPFFGYEIDINAPNKNIYCCRLAENSDINKVRKHIHLKERAPECGTCWQLEDKCLKSERQIHNLTLDFYEDKSIENLELEAIKNGYKTKIVKLATSNICNGQCVTCSPSASSSWAALTNTPINYQQLDIDKLNLNLKNIIQIGFVGGEPFLEKKNFLILERILQEDNTECFVNIVTNGSIRLTDKQIYILKQFKNLNLCFSIDGVEKAFEYLRYPLVWDNLLYNLDVAKSITNNISVSSMISNLSILYYSTMIDFFQYQKINYLFKQIEYPTIFNPGNLPNAIKQYIVDKNSRHSDQVSKFLSLTSATENSWGEFKSEIVYQDNLKQILLSDYMPELAKLINYSDYKN